jgi:FAD/FMN-containing dehydrogenase
MIIHRTGNKSWTNRHETFTQVIDNLYNLGNNNSGNVLADYNDATQSIQKIIKEAVDANKQLRVLGGEWSWTKIAAATGILLNTKSLNLSFQIGAGNVSKNYTKLPADLYFAQCGNSVKELSDRLRTTNRSLKTTGASNGQTIVGAMSTGTHGSAIDVGSVPDYVVGLHIIVSPTRHVYLERKSYPVVSDSFVKALNAELVQDDGLFNAALVSFGCFGFIHGVMIETVPLFLYQCYRLRMPMDNDLFLLMETLDFTNTKIKLPFGKERPYHFQTLINPYETNGANVTVMYHRPYKAGYTPPSMSPGIRPGDDAPAFIGNITDAVPNAVPILVNKLIAASYAPYNNMWGTHSEIFTNTDIHGKVLSCALGVSLDRVGKVRQLLMDINKTSGPFAGVFAFRFVKGTMATLGFTRFPETCVIELDSVLSKESYKFYNSVWDELVRQNIPFTFHWGKILQLDAIKIRTMYTDQRVNNWLAARKTLMQDEGSMRAFTNESMQLWGLDGIAADATTGTIVV